MKTNIIKITGNWDAGISLDKHTIKSVPIGPNEFGHMQNDTTRTEVGEALYQLKFKGDQSKVEPLAKSLYEKVFSLYDDIDLIVPIAPSKNRKLQPVYELCKALAKIAGLKSYEDLIQKLPATDGDRQLKDMATKKEKTAALEGRISFSDVIEGEEKFNILLVDDLHDTGASLEASCTALRGYSKIGKIYAATLTWK